MALFLHRKYRLSQLRQRNNKRSPAYLSGLDIQILKFLPRQELFVLRQTALFC